jgi:hypothetical protein
MSDIKLFRISNGAVHELQGPSIAIEKTLQTLIETQLEGFLGVRFLATEYPTGKTHGGRCTLPRRFARLTHRPVSGQPF